MLASLFVFKHATVPHGRVGVRFARASCKTGKAV
jgi:hypothetical protein